MTQQYPNNQKVIAPGTVIVSSGAEVSDVRKVVSPVLVNDKNSSLYYIDFSFDEQRLGGSAFWSRYFGWRINNHAARNGFCQPKGWHAP